MSVCVVTGAAGLIGSETVRFFASQGLNVIGIDNDMRSQFFGAAASTAWNRQALEREVRGYRHEDFDIRDLSALERLFSALGSALAVVVHCAAQPSHDWAASDAIADFSIKRHWNSEPP
jgi:CDP-paratose 2-epimerase